VVSSPGGGSGSETEVLAAFNVFLSLTPSQQEQFRRWVRTYDESNVYGKTEIRTKIARVSLGPLNDSRCPYCGK
jgi:hypothetical protein